MKSQGKRHSLVLSGNITVNDGEIARDLAIEGVGLTLLPQFFVLNQLKTGQLVEVLQGHVDSKVGLYVVYPNNKYLTPKVRVFIDFVVDYFQNI